MWRVEFDIVEVPQARITANSGKVTVIAHGKQHTYEFKGFKTVEIPGTLTPAKVIWETDYPAGIFKIEGAVETGKLIAGIIVAGILAAAIAAALRR